MDGHSLELILEFAIIGLLVAVIIYAFRLNKALSVLKQSREEMELLLKEFAGSTNKAEAAIAKIKEASGQNSAVLNGLLRQAETLRDDLSFLIERGEKIADSLEGGVSSRRSAPVQGAQSPRASRPLAGQERPLTAEAPSAPAPTRPGGPDARGGAVDDDIAAALFEARQLAEGGGARAASSASSASSDARKRPGLDHQGLQRPASSREEDPLLRRAEGAPLPSRDAGPQAGANVERHGDLPSPGALSRASEGGIEEDKGDDSQSGDDAPKSKSALLRALQGMR